MTDGLQHVRLTGECFYEPELLRLEAKVLAAEGDEPAAVDALHRAVEVARKLGLKLARIRAVGDLENHPWR